jgi:hypothetical protein
VAFGHDFLIGKGCSPHHWYLSLDLLFYLGFFRLRTVVSLIVSFADLWARTLSADLNAVPKQKSFIEFHSRISTSNPLATGNWH